MKLSTGVFVLVSAVLLIQVNGQPTGTPCQIERQKAKDRAERFHLPNLFVPACTKDGNYDAIQCDKASASCRCVDRITGKATTQPRKGKPTNCK
ncbi:hypothetical protein V8B55DRAFT_1441725 [Mucor lusitanicus]